jgi:succinoglycan biosynthesis transport protein ExoP
MLGTSHVPPSSSELAVAATAPTIPSLQHRDAPRSWEADGPSLQSIVRRHIALVVACTIVCTIATALFTSRLPRVFEASASVRIDQQLSRPSVLEGIGISGNNVLATEVEMLSSRQLAREVADSVGYRLRVRQPANVSRSTLFSHVEVAPDAAPDSFRLARNPDASFTLLSGSGDTLDRGVRAGQRIRQRGITLELSPSAAKIPAAALQVVSSDEATDSLRRATQVARRNREADLVDVKVRDVDPALARDVANTLVRRFIAGREGVKQLEARSNVEFLRSQLSRVSGQLTDAERRLRAFREGQGIVSLPDEASTGVTRRAELQAQRNTLEAERQALDRVFHGKRGAGQSPGDSVVLSRELLAFPTLLRSGIAGDLVTALGAAEERRADLLTRRTNQDPDVVLVNARITQIQRSIQGLVSTYLRGLTDQVAALDALLSQSDSKLQTIPGKEIRLGELERTAKGSEAIYSMLQSRLKEAEITAASSDQTVRVVDAASLPRRPISPNPLLNLGLALLSGSLIGMAGALLLEHGDRSLHTRRELLAATGVPVLGIVPHLELTPRLPRLLSGAAARLKSGRTAVESTEARAKRNANRFRGTFGGTESLFVFTEAVSRLAINLTLFTPEQPPRVLLCTSALPGDGKTTVATNLALAIARSGRRVLLIDADLRGGRIAHALSVKHAPGLAEVLDGSVQAGDAAQELTGLSSGPGTLHVIAAGAATTAAARLLASGRAADLIAWARENYDMVIMDTPPVTSIADATLLAPISDGVVLVVRSGVTLRDAIAFAVEQLQIIRAPVLGAVLNDVDLRREGAYDGAYEYYGRYAAAIVR